MQSQYDAIVLGGGPAGATAATLLAQGGHSTLLLERSPRTTFKVGESLMPATYWTLERLGVLERMRDSFFPKKFSVQFFTQDGRGSAPFYFFENDDHVSSQTWQVLRSDFDRLLLDNARRHGADVRMGMTVTDVLLDGERAEGVRVRSADGAVHEVASRVVVDATGQSSLLARKLGLKEIDPCLRHVSYYTHFEGARRDEGVDEGATLILHTDNANAWFWFIPLPEDRVSVGVVGPLDYLVQGRSSEPQQVFEEELARCPAVAERLVGADQSREVKVAKDFSYKASKIAGDGWILAGDAYGFLDPIYSSGVFLALKSGEMAADTACAALTEGDLSETRLRAHEAEYSAGMEALKKLVYAFYDPNFSFGRFLKKRPELREPVIDLLVGNVYRKDVRPLLDALDSRWADERKAAGMAPSPDDESAETEDADQAVEVAGAAG